MNEIKLGEVFELKGKKVKVVEDIEGIACCNCVFFIEKFDLNKDNCENKDMLCMCIERKDDKNVKFIEVKED